MTLTIPARFNGPPRSGNGGWSAGAIAGLVVQPSVDAPVVEVRLRQPPPLDTPLTLDGRDGWTLATHLGEVVLQARPSAAEPTPVDPVDPAAARTAEASYAGLRSHPFPTCFSCGPDRSPGDGLRIFPGPVGTDRAAATWTPGPDVDAPTTWAALDCAGAWTAGVDERPMVLGSITARLLTVPVAGEEHVVVGQHRGSEGRRVHTATSAYTADGRLVGCAEAVWFVVDPATFG